MPISYNPELSDVFTDGYVAGALSVSTTPVEVKVGASVLEGREFLTIQNLGPRTIYYGPSGVTSSTGTALVKDQTVGFPPGTQSVFVVTSSGTSDVRIQELA